MRSTVKNFSEGSGIVAGWAAVLLVFAAPTSRALFNIAAAVLIIAWILSAEYNKKLKIIIASPIFYPVIFLSGIMVIGGFYTPAPPSDMWMHFKVYSKLFYILLLIPVFSDPVVRARGWWAFVTAMLLIVISTYLNIFFNLPWSKSKNLGLGADHSVFTDYIVQGVITSFFAMYCFQKSFNYSARNFLKVKVIWFLLGLLTSLSIVFLLQGRSGVVTLLVAAFVLFWVNTTGRIKWFVLLLFSAIAVVTLLSSSILMGRINLAIHELNNLKPVMEETSSIGLRWHMWVFSFNQMIENPWFGTGTGSYHVLAEKYFGHCNFTCFHPHNQYLFFGMEHGFTGLFLYFYLIYGLYKSVSISLNFEWKICIVFIVVLAVNSLFNAPLWYRMESYIFYTMMGLLASSYVIESRKPED